MQAKDVVVRVQALDGTWETCGADRARGVVPENVQLVSDQWGSKTASFDLRRDPKATWPDISAFAPVEVEVGGRLVWSGRVAETPVRDSTDSVINVQCEGWQAHLDDDLYERIYVHTNLSDYVDARSFPQADLSRSGTAAGQVQAGDGGLVLSFPQGTALTGGVSAYAAAVLDLGPNSLAKRVVFDAIAPSRTGTGSRFGFHCRLLNSPSMAETSFEDVTALDLVSLSTSTATTSSGTVTTARRYVMFFLYHSGAASFTTAEDNTVRITNVQVFADTAYESGNVSILKADQVVKDALNRATLQLSTDQTSVAAGTFNIPELAPSEPKTPRQMWDAVNAFEDYQSKIDVLRRPIFRSKPTTPEVEVGSWSGMEFEDSSSNSGDDIYNRVTVTGSKADNSPLRVTRSQGDQPNPVLTVPTSPIASNPSFDTNTTGWTATNSTITRDTGASDTSPAAGRWDNTGASDVLNFDDQLSGTFTGTFTAGRTYVVSFRMKSSASAWAYATFGTSTDYAMNLWVVPSTSAYSTFSVTWTPRETVTSGVTLRFSDRSLFFGWSAYYWLDTVTLYTSRTTLVDRRNFVRSKTIASSFTLTESAAQQLADKWLVSHKTSPFKGRAKLTGNQATREIKTGRNVPPEEMLLRTGELVRFGDRIDPDTGAAGRDGRLVEAQYNADADSVDITIDSSRAGFEALLERLGVVLGQNRFS